MTRLFGRTDFFNRIGRFLSVDIGSHGLIRADRNKDCLEALQVLRLAQSDQGGRARGQRSDRRQRPYYN